MLVSEPCYQRQAEFVDSHFVFNRLDRALEEAQVWVKKGQNVRIYHYSADGLNCYDDFNSEET
jgi:23S rRNA G2069 N7-methylase RlmK/C1962 C5-methylase RlmI